MMDVVTLKVLSGLLNVMAVFLHTLGAYLLICVYKTGLDKPETVYLINLSISEVLVAMCGFLSVICSSVDVDFILKFDEYISLLNHYGFCIMYYVAMILLMINR